MAHNSKLEISSTNKVHIFPSPNTKTGTNSLFPWSPRTSQSLIVKPEVLTPKANYSIQPAFRTKSGITSKVQEISIDRTWFRSTDVSNKDDKRREKTNVTTADSHRPLLTEKLTDKSSVVSHKIKETRKVDNNSVTEELIHKSVKTGYLEAIGKRNDTRQSSNNALEAKTKVTDFLPNTSAYVDSETDVLNERLDKVEQLILQDKQVLAEFGQPGGKSKHETEYKPFQESNNIATQGQEQGLIRTEPNNADERHNKYVRSDSCSASVCSSCSVASTYPSRSRCSSGDGCSSVECDETHANVCSLHSHGQYQHGSFVRGGDMNSSCSKESLEQLLFKTPLLARKNPVCDTRETEPNTFLKSQNHSHCNCDEDQLSKTIRHAHGRQSRTPQVDGKDGFLLEEAHSCCGHITKKTNSISQVQLMFYILKLQICKYGELKSVIEAQQLTLSCQSQSINRLIQCVMLLSMKLHQQTSSLDCLTAALRRQENERQSTKRRQTVFITTVLGLVCIYVLQLETVQGKIVAFFRMFGITRQLKSLNRKRRMISEIWRDIPPLLTNFWRIFIFHGET